jgi:archaellum component FlaG (FlaF/FlaG flagellin family)
MKFYRLVTLIVAVLITASLARFFADQKVGDAQEQIHATAGVP